MAKQGMIAKEIASAKHFDNHYLEESLLLSMYISEYIMKTKKTESSALGSTFNVNFDFVEEINFFSLAGSMAKVSIGLETLEKCGMIKINDSNETRAEFVILKKFSDILYNTSDVESMRLISTRGRAKRTDIHPYNDEEFENCWEMYKRKGCKKKAVEIWKKLSEKDIERVKEHIPFYVSSVSERVYQKDFERYLMYGLYDQPVFKNNVEVYNPEDNVKREDGVYTPRGNMYITFNKNIGCYCTVDDIRTLFDGYDKEDRPDGARIYKNGVFYVWSSSDKEWKVEER